VIVLCAIYTGPAHATGPASFPEAIEQGKFSVNARARYESVDQTGLKDAEALTLRTRLGFTTAAFHGWKAMVEGENIVAADGDRYSQSGLNPGGSGRAVVADPETTEWNQAWLAYSSGQTTFTLGKQRLVLDNARFIGDVGWRQNMQTFDAVVLQDKTFDKTTLTYAYLDRINRVFSRRHAQGRWDSDSHLFNASHAGLAAGTVTGYAYLLDFDNSATNSCATYGLAFAGERPLQNGAKLTYRAEFALQRDHGSSPLNYSTDYRAFEFGVAAKSGGLAFGHEELGSDNGVSFRTPLATLHAYNGWADLFLTTPANGLRDTYVKASATLPEGINLLVFLHWYEADRLGAGYGREANVQFSRKFGPRFTATAKYARFDRDLASMPDVSKFWLQVEFVY
jgi:hypothetical protein